jgi:hypothetical protein
MKRWLPAHPVPRPLISIPALANPDARPTTSAKTHMMTIVLILSPGLRRCKKDRDGRDET